MAHLKNFNMKKTEIYISFILLSLAFVVLLLTLYPYRRESTLLQQQVKVIPTVTVIPTNSPVIILSPNLSQPFKSPQRIVGLIDKSWVFEGSFPIKLFDSQNKILFDGIASAPNWLEGEEKLTDFSATLKFSTTSLRGYLKIKNDNPSGLPQNDKNFNIPIIFSIQNEKK